MAWTQAKDVSKYQGNWQDTGEPIVLIKMSGGDAGLYMDSQASANYDAAVKAGKAVGGYHFGGGAVSAEAEAAYFIKAMYPLAENDVYALDVEANLANRSDVVQWVSDFVDFVHGQVNVWPLVYMNLSTLNAHDWSQVLQHCGLWLADWAVSPDANIPTHYTYVMQQYNDGPNYDHDAFFGTVEEFKAYGYHASQAQAPAPEPPQPTATPTPTPQPAPTPAPSPSAPAETTPTPATDEAPEPTPAPIAVSEPVPAAAPVTAPVQAPKVVAVETPKDSFWQVITNFFKELF